MEKIEELTNKLYQIHPTYKVSRAKFQTERKGPFHFFKKAVEAHEQSLAEQGLDADATSPPTKRKSLGIVVPKVLSSDDESDDEGKGVPTQAQVQNQPRPRVKDPSARVSTWQERKSTYDLVGEFLSNPVEDPMAAPIVTSLPETPAPSVLSRSRSIDALQDNLGGGSSRKFERPSGPPPPRPRARLGKQNSALELSSSFPTEVTLASNNLDQEDDKTMSELKDLLLTADSLISDTSSRKSIVEEVSSDSFYVVREIMLCPDHLVWCNLWGS